jgi:DNA-binding NarL/FixJ family response regulator
MNKGESTSVGSVASTLLEQAQARAIQAEARTEQAKTRTEMAETRTEQAETRTEQAKTRAEQAEVRSEQAEMRTERAEAALQREVQKEVNLTTEPSTRLLNHGGTEEKTGWQSPPELLTSRQREILQHIAEGQNTKQIAEMLKVSPKTVEYHRMKLMAGLKLHDVAGLVRYALRVGLVKQAD